MEQAKDASDMELIWCPPGSFIMGPGGEDSLPKILTKGFYLGKYEVTQEEYEKVMSKNPRNLKVTNFLSRWLIE